jgi:hypothetical protein
MPLAAERRCNLRVREVPSDDAAGAGGALWTGPRAHAGGRPLPLPHVTHCSFALLLIYP